MFLNCCNPEILVVTIEASALAFPSLSTAFITISYLFVHLLLKSLILLLTTFASGVLSFHVAPL